MSNNPADIANQAFDDAGVDYTIGDLEEGTRPAQVALRAYGQCLRQLLRAVHWNFARQQDDLVLLGDATGQTAGVSTIVPVPWTYKYAYPANCMKARFLPRSLLNPSTGPVGNISIPNVPLTTGSQLPYQNGMRLIPAPFLITFDPNTNADPASNWAELQGESPTGSVVILSNVKSAQMIFTALITAPSVWDSQFRQAMVSFMASKVALPLSKDKKFGVQMRDQNIKLAKDMVMAARVSDGNEAPFPSTTDSLPDWMRIRATGGNAGWSNSGSGCGGMWGSGGFGFDGLGFLGYGFDQSVF